MNKQYFLIILVFILLLIGGVFAGRSLKKYQEKKTQGNASQPTEPAQKAEKDPVLSLLPQNSKDSEDFLDQVNKKAEEIKKNYDSNLTSFARKKWEKYFEDVNNVNNDFLANHIIILEQTTEKTPNQSTIFKIKYKIKIDWAEADTQDTFFLLLSDKDKKEKNLSQASNIFLTDKEIESGLSNKDFGHITKIKAQDTLAYATKEEAEKILSDQLGSQPENEEILVDSEKTLQNKQEPSNHLYIWAKNSNNSAGEGNSCKEAFVSLLDKNIKFVANCSP